MTSRGSPFAAFAEEWLAAFNAHDLDRIMRHYHDDIELVSRLYLAWTGGISDRVRGSAAFEA